MALRKADLRLYDILCRMERDIHGFVVEDDADGPLLVAENQTFEAQQSLMKILERMTWIPIRELTAEGMDRYMEYWYLVMRQLEL